MRDKRHTRDHKSRIKKRETRDISEIKDKQDKVNYAVSEREDRVTDVMMLKRMTGCTGMYWAAIGLQMGCTEL